MSSVNILGMTTPFQLLALRRRPQRKREPRRSGGRAWINGREVGGTEARFAHLSAGSD